jgi:hypothetical protein
VPERIDDTILFQDRGFFHFWADAKRRLTDGKTSQPQSFALAFRGLGAEPTNKRLHFVRQVHCLPLFCLLPGPVESNIGCNFFSGRLYVQHNIQWKQNDRFGHANMTAFTNPNFVKMAQSMGCKGYRVQSADDLRTILDDAFRQDVPAVIDCPVDYGENVLLTQRLKAIIDGHSA